MKSFCAKLSFNPRSPKLKIVTRTGKGVIWTPAPGFRHFFLPIFFIMIFNESLAQKLFIAKKKFEKNLIFDRVMAI